MVRAIISTPWTWGLLAAVAFFRFTVPGRLAIQARMTWVLVSVFVVYLSSARGLSNDKTAEVWRALQISLSFMCCVAYWKRAMGCFQVVGRWPDQTQLISLGIVMSWASVCSNGLWGMFWRLSGQPPWMVNNDFYQSWVMFNCVAATLHIMAPNLLGTDVRLSDRARLAGAFGLALALIAILSVVRPNLEPLSEFVRPYLDTQVLPALAPWRTFLA